MIQIESNSKFVTDINQLRLSISNGTNRADKQSLGQFFTDPQLALFMSDLFLVEENDVRLLDPGAGIGILTMATVFQLCKLEQPPNSIEAVAVEVDNRLIPTLIQSMEYCKGICSEKNIQFTYNIVQEDFVDFYANTEMSFNKIILNPPYKKINSNSQTKKLLRQLGIESTNLYTAFLSLSKRLLTDNGELVAITPRSFCNGPYFLPFRIDFLNEMAFSRIHIYESRKDAFREDDVLQENIIFRAVKAPPLPQITISSSANVEGPVTFHLIDYNRLIYPADPNKFIHILKDEEDLQIRLMIEGVSSNLSKLGLHVSTGRVVDFRTIDNLKAEPGENTVPLIYPSHFHKGYVRWPLLPSDKPNAILKNESTIKSLVPNGNYVLVRRFSSKEETRRIVPAIVTSDTFDTLWIGFENHVNFFHIGGAGLPLDVAKGLALYLSSTLVDRYFRQFNGHTQVNVGDLKSLPYPSLEQIKILGSNFNDEFPNQQEIDRIISEVMF